ncbi:hypothetical protein SASPL_128361 [Salvia splendens]|uniref:Uncharacterized protein n=1 Tax=Salvia splendens TaxID=180675 RepID=A0A8X8XBD7_SALSN|nr:hypothetical protein SASPL_128361 [Salvia splendens]
MYSYPIDKQIKYSHLLQAALELLSVIEGENLRSRRIQIFCATGGYSYLSSTWEYDGCISSCSLLKKERGFDGDAVANLVVGLTFCQLWYSGLPEELQLTALDSFGFGLQSEIPIDKIHMPIEYSKEDSPHEAGGDNLDIHCISITSVANDKEVDSREESAKPNGISGSSFSDCSGDLPQASIFLTQGLPPWLLPLKLPISRENLEDAVRMRRELLNDDYKNAVKHLRVALHTTPPAIEALHPFIQDLAKNSKLQASLLEHFDSGNYVKLCTYFEDILKKDPTCNDSLSRLVLMHQRVDYDTQSLVEMLALHLDASYGTCDMWQELASCLLKLSQCEGDRESSCNRGCLDDSNRVPELFTCGKSGKGWRLRCRWWLNRHFHDRILMSEIASGNNPFRFVCFMDEAYK